MTHLVTRRKPGVAGKAGMCRCLIRIGHATVQIAQHEDMP